MRAALLVEAQKPFVVIDDLDVAEPRVGEVRVRVSHCGICHSDLTYAESGPGVVVPCVLGHEAAGVVDAIGPGVRSVARGDKVMLTPMGPCGRCYFCARQQPTLCVDARGFMTGLFPDGTTPLSRKGQRVYRGFAVAGFGEATVLAEAGVVKLPSDTPLEIACVIGCAVQTGVGAVLNTAKVEEGATVFVGGLGGIGVSITQGARLAGASKIIVSDPVASRRDAAGRFGATHVLDPGKDDVVARCHELTNGIGVDYAFDGAGSTAVMQQCIAASRPGGTTVLVGAPASMAALEIPIVSLFLSQEKRVIGSLLGSCLSQRDVPRFIEFWRRGLLDLEGMISHRRPIAEINSGFEDLRAARGIRTVLSF
jgi:Zn-dependent alcohol dehydrogenase